MIAESNTVTEPNYVESEATASAPAAEDGAAKTQQDSEFANYALLPAVQKAIAQRGYTTATAIQSKSIPPILEGGDVVGQAETGTGKTAAFALPLLSRIDLSHREPQVLVLAPTRELAIQVAEAFENYGQYLPKLGVATVYGGQHFRIQLNQLQRGAHVVVGTPGRIMDHMRRGQLSLDSITTVVLDEADEMLRMGFAEDMEWIFGQAPTERQTLLFSATLPDSVSNVAAQYLSNPTHIRAKRKAMTAATVTQRVCCVKYRDKVDTVGRLLASEVTDGVIVFVKTREMSSRLAEEFCQRGYRASALNGDMQQNQRERTVGRLKSGQLDILVATDVAARGLDVERVSHVINFDFPHDAEAYTHRIGRTGRAGRAGNAILLITPKEKFKLRSLEKATRQSLTWMEPPTAASVAAARTEKLMTKVEKAVAGNLTTQHAYLAEFMLQHPERTIEDLAAGLLAVMTHDEHDDRDRLRNDLHEGKRKRDRKNERSFADRVMGRGTGREARPDKRGYDGKGKKRSPAQYPDRAWTKYRIEVGYKHGVRPGNIVGAITSESGLVGTDIGGIDIQTHFSTIDLPPDLTEDQVEGLQYLKVAGQALRLSKWKRSGKHGGSKAEGRGGKAFAKPRRDKKKKNKKAKSASFATNSKKKRQAVPK